MEWLGTKFDTWVIAAVHLLERGDDHYRTLADDIRNTGLTTLGAKGRTPYQSLGAILRTQRYDGRDVFEGLGYGDGQYKLVDPEWIAALPIVREAQQALENVRRSHKGA